MLTPTEKLPVGGVLQQLPCAPTRGWVHTQPGLQRAVPVGPRDDLVSPGHSQHSALISLREPRLMVPQDSQPRHRTFMSSALNSSSSASVRPSTAGVWAATAVSTGTSVMESDKRPLLGEFRLISARDKTRPESAK